MKYISTRSGKDRLSFEDTVLTGLAPDGGLFIPEKIPSLPSDWETKWSTLTFEELALEIYSHFIDAQEIPRQDLAKLIQKSYSTFRSKDVTPLVSLDESQGGISILELFHGPTFAFKDVALQFLGNLFEYFLVRKNQGKAADDPTREKLTIVGATSGDTGSAAIYGLRNKQDVSVFILHPKGKISPIQEAQMTTVQDANVFNLAVKGTFDDCQDIVKTLFADKEFNDKYHVGAINSINWARILAQTVYYFYAYFQYRKASSSSAPAPQFVVPTGNFGDILAGWYAYRMGLPMQKLVCATNENDILARFWKTGSYAKEGSDGSSVKETLSPAMDILVSSNFERLLWYLIYEQDCDKNVEAAGDKVGQLMQDLKSKGSFKVSEKVHRAALNEVQAERVSDQETKDTIRQVFEQKSYVSDPHTAVALTAAQRVKLSSSSSSSRQIALATAHPAKFSEAVEGALSGMDNFNFERDVLPQEFKGILTKERKVETVDEANAQLTKQVIINCLGR